MDVVAGLIVSVLASRLPEAQRMLAVVAVATVTLGLCESLDMPYLLAFLVMGVTLANASALTPDILQQLNPLARLLYVVFFVPAGAELDLRALWAAGAVGGTYVLTR